MKSWARILASLLVALISIVVMLWVLRRDLASQFVRAEAPQRNLSAPYFRANLTTNLVDGSVSPTATVWITATNSSGTIKGTATTSSDNTGWFWGTGLTGADLVPGDVVTVTDSAGVVLSTTLISITGQLDTNTSVISGTMAGGDFTRPGAVEFNKRDDLWLYFTSYTLTKWDLGIQPNGSYTFNITTAPGGQNVATGDWVQVWYIGPDENATGIDLYDPLLRLDINRSHDWLQGEVYPPATTYLTVTRGTQIVGTSIYTPTTDGRLNFNIRDGNGVRTDIQVGDIVTATAGELVAGVPIINMTGTVNANTADVSGQFFGLTYPAQGRVETWGAAREPGFYWHEFSTDNSGYFTMNYSDTHGIHFKPGGMISIWAYVPGGNTVIIARLDMQATVDLGSCECIYGNTTPSATVNITATRGGQILGASSIVAEPIEGHFQTQVYSNSQIVSLNPGDEIQLAKESRPFTISIYPAFTAGFDPVQDTVFGFGPPNTAVELDVWGHACCLMGTTDWLGFYRFYTNVPEYGNHDLLPSSQGMVSYYDVDGSRVRHSFFDVEAPITGLTAANSGPALVSNTVSFTSTIITGANVAYIWDFGDGAYDIGATPVHTYTHSGIYTATVAAANSAGSVTATTPVNINDVQVVATVGQTQTLTYTASSGVTTTVEIPPAALTQTVTLAYTVVETPTTPTGFAFAGQAFTLDAYSGTTALDNFTFVNPVTVTLYYANADVQGTDELALKLNYWDVITGQWIEAACGPYDRHPAENWLSVPICHLTEFGLFGPAISKLYLPLVRR